MKISTTFVSSLCFEVPIKENLNVVAVYDDFSAGQWAEEVTKRFTRSVHEGDRVNKSFWKSDKANLSSNTTKVKSLNSLPGAETARLATSGSVVSESLFPGNTMSKTSTTAAIQPMAPVDHNVPTGSSKRPPPTVPRPGTPSPVPMLIAQLQAPDAGVAHAAAVALRAFDDPTVMHALSTVIRNTDGFFHRTVRTSAAESLGRIKDRRAVDALVGALRYPVAEPSVNAACIPRIMGEVQAVEPWLAAVRNPDGHSAPIVRLSAMEALSCFRVPAAQALFRRVANDPHADPALRQASRAALAVSQGKA